VYRWLLFLHIAMVLGFMLAHGVQVMIMLKQRSEPDPERNLALFDILPDVLALRILLVSVVATGFLLVAALSVWDRWWIWLSLSLLALIWIAMYRFGGAYYTLLEEAATRAIGARGRPSEADAAAAFARARRAWYPAALAVTGLGGIAVILWLMVFQPF
jgi:hypothetical protein